MKRPFAGFSLSQPVAKKPRLPTIAFSLDDPEPAPKPKRVFTPLEPLDSLPMEQPIEKENSTPIVQPVKLPEVEMQTEEVINVQQKDNNDESDSLAAYMAGISNELVNAEPSEGPKIRRDDYEEEDNIESFVKYQNQKLLDAEKKAEAQGKKFEELEYDSDDNPILTDRKEMEPLPPIDHSQINYEPFEKNFYKPLPESEKMTKEQLKEYKKNLQIRVSWETEGGDPPQPCKKFELFGLDQETINVIHEVGYQEPTPIQQQAVPVAMSGRDIIGIAKTGSGKTCAFVWPMITHINDQRPLEKGDGPIGIIVAPARELASQIYLETKKFCKPSKLKVASLFGGLKNKKQQVQKLKKGVHIIVCTPGRLIDMIKIKVLKMDRVTFLVLDEADRMFDMGFEPQVRSIVGQVRPDRQTLMFSATFKRDLEELAKDILINPLRITVGYFVGAANEDITQVVHIFENEEEKWPWLFSRLQHFVKEGSVLIFCSKIQDSEQLTARINSNGFTTAAIHGDKSQQERTKIMFAFKHQNLPILVATDVAARGLDIKSIKTVINYQAARDIESHTHRVGRTGRAGEKGVAYTLLTKLEANFAKDLVKNLQAAKQYVSPELTELAKKGKGSKKDKKSRGPWTGPGGGPGSTPQNKFAGIGYETTHKKAPTQQNAKQQPQPSGQYKVGGSSFVKATNTTPKTKPTPPKDRQDPLGPPPQIRQQAVYDPLEASEEIVPPYIPEPTPPIQRYSRAEVLKQAMMHQFKQSFTPSSSNSK